MRITTSIAEIETEIIDAMADQMDINDENTDTVSKTRARKIY